MGIKLFALDCTVDGLIAFMHLCGWSVYDINKENIFEKTFYNWLYHWLFSLDKILFIVFLRLSPW